MNVLIGMQKDSEALHEEPVRRKISLAIRYIEENYASDINMAVVSNYVSMNYSLFSYAFKQYTGENFVTYLKNIRLKKAKEMLETTDEKVLSIGAAVGYENSKHFMKLFKSEYGISPSEYRKNMQKAE
ncbi:MAG: AraC family transcriptional regulator, partial [Lachnospiraceae bacterium]|nr:AraC family transcriptional regulator [Lachnospiraceae bacterium]